MDILEAIENRRSIRAFKEKPVPKHILEKILLTARWSPSGHNTQPWEVAVLMGKKKDELSRRLLEAVEQRKERKFDYFEASSFPPFLQKRRDACDEGIFKHKKIDIRDKKAVKQHILENYYFFHAPVELILFMERGLGCGQFIDVGMFAQSVMLAALEFGLGTCCQGTIALYPQVIREFLGLPENKIILFGIAMGYPDEEASVNRYRPPREPLEGFVRFYE
ncbi:MAG: nitroreductase [Deltaproteobacteria bacterium]|nr:nitroreductase [Deltaproteobacteria bacterium]